MGPSKRPKLLVFGLFLACWSFSHNEALKVDRNISTSTRPDHAFTDGAVFVHILSAVNKLSPQESALDQLIDIILTTLLHEGVRLRLDYPIHLIERPHLQVSNVLLEGLHRVSRECPTRISTEELRVSGRTVRNTFVDLCFHLDELTMIGQFSTGFPFISPQLQILPQTKASKTDSNGRQVRQLLYLSDLSVDQWSGLRFESADLKGNYVKRFVFKMLEIVTRVSSLATRLAFQRSLRISMQQIFANLTFIDPFFYPTT
ncbi:unnamed protein product [Dibothriocephalus latus]|uniref:Lipid-binding serum glycoprotein N-terminal domain-containing protein n=1 Tax=Dibothriocephalus latus TaxID=60516 RepID=A0A3P6SZT1_DIBLA|nr:unnamed protein product [Dibothriocephalus latus]